jgi:ribosomal protein S12 methylthiotransferase
VSTPARTVALVSLGCPKNLVDSEDLVAGLMGSGFRVLTEPEHADLVVVNTCGFLEASRKESVDVIRAMVSLKDRGVRRVAVAGCMVGNYREVLDREAPGVDRYIPFADYASVARIALELLPETAPEFLRERRRFDVSLTPAHYAWLKISEGCNHSCSFCVIPDIRGPMRSVPEPDLLGRAARMIERGVREICLIAQDSTVYGADLHGSSRLDRLFDGLEDLEGPEGAPWLRLLYAYPTELRPPVLDRLAGGRRLLPYLDVPIQHAADGVLRRMRRGYGRRELETLVSELRRRRSDFVLRTTVIVGFPGETEADFAQLLDFLRAARFDHLGAFIYSREPGSRADSLDGHLPKELQEERWHRLLAAQQEIAFAAQDRRIGTTELVVVDAPARDGRPARGRTWREAPEIDTAVLLDDPGLRPGDLVRVRIAAREGYDLRAVLEQGDAVLV